MRDVITSQIGVASHQTEELALCGAVFPEVGDAVLFSVGSGSRGYQANTHPDCEHAFIGSTPWIAASPDSSLPSGEHMVNEWKCALSVDMAALEEIMTGTEPFYLTRYEFDADRRRIKAYVDSSSYWSLPDWTSIQVPVSPKWTTIKLSSLTAGSAYHCIFPLNSEAAEHSYHREVVPCLAGSSRTVEREGEHCYVLSLFSDFSASGKQLKKMNFVSVGSQQVELAPEQDTIFVKIYR